MHVLTREPLPITREPLPITIGQLEELLQRVLGLAADDALVQRLLRILLETAVQGATQPASALGQSPTLTADNPILRRLATNHVPKIVGINETTREAIRARLVNVIAEGGSLREQVAGVRSVFQDASRARATTIARTESNIFWHAGGHEQMREFGVRSHTWLASQDGRVRDSHAEAHNQCQEFGTGFYVGSSVLQHPGDPSGPPEEIINCYLPGTLVRGDFVAGVRSEYVGPAREIVTLHGHRLRVTVHHPVLTPQGWVSAGDIYPSQDLLCYRPVGNLPAGGLAANQENEPAAIEDVFQSLAIRPAVVRRVAPVRPTDLHGDAARVVGEVEVVLIDGLLRDELYAPWPECIEDLSFVLEHSAEIALAAERATEPLFHRDVSAPELGPHGFHAPFHGAWRLADCLPVTSARVGCSAQLDAALSEMRRKSVVWDAERRCDAQESLSFTVSTDDVSPLGFGLGRSCAALGLNASITESVLKGGVVDASFPCQGLRRLPSCITTDQVIEVRDFDFRGHVYDLQSTTGLMIASGVVASNCRCTELPGVGPCGSRSYSQEELVAAWHRAIRPIMARERLALRTMRGVFAEQRQAVLEGLAATAGHSSRALAG